MLTAYVASYPLPRALRRKLKPRFFAQPTVKYKEIKGEARQPALSRLYLHASTFLSFRCLMPELTVDGSTYHLAPAAGGRARRCRGHIGAH